MRSQMQHLRKEGVNTEQPMKYTLRKYVPESLVNWSFVHATTVSFNIALKPKGSRSPSVPTHLKKVYPVTIHAH